LASIASLRATEDAIVDLVVKQDHPKSPLRDLVQDFLYGTSVKSGSTGTPVLRIPNVSRRRLDLTDLKLVELPAVEVQRLELDDGDLLFVRSNGNPDLVGANIEVSGLKVPFVFASYLIRARMSRSVNSTCVSKFLDAKAGRSQLRSNATTSAGQYNSNTRSFGAIEVPIPPLGEQVDIARKIRLVSEHRALLEAHLAKLDELFASLQYRAFRGGL
jgi:type I restriction enzyme S subunit